MRTAAIKSRLIISLFLIFLIAINAASRFGTEYCFIVLLLATLIAPSIKKLNFSSSLLYTRFGGEYFFIFWIAALIISHLVNNNLHRHEISEIGEFRWLLGIYPLVAAFLYSRVSREAAVATLYAVSVLCAVFIASYTLNPPLGVFGYPSRMTGFFESPTDFGHTIAFPFLFAFGLLILPDNDFNYKQKTVLFFPLLLIGACLFLSYTRAAQGAVLVSCLFLMASIGRRVLLKGMSFLAIITGLAYKFNFLSLKDRIDFSLRPHETYDNHRILLAKAHWSLFKDHPFFGVGFHQNRFELEPYFKEMGVPFQRDFIAHAHNQVLNLLSGTGILGATAYISIIVFFINIGLQNYRHFSARTFNKNLSLILLICLLYFVIAGFADTNFDLMAPKYYLLVVWSLIIYQHRLYKAAKTN